MDHIDIVHRHLPGLELQIDGAFRVEGVVGGSIGQHQILTIFMQVLLQRSVTMRSWNNPKAAILAGRRVQSDPDGAGRQRPDRPVMTVLVPGRFIPRQSGFTKHLTAPQNDIVSEQIRHHVENGGILSQFQEFAAAANTFGTFALDMGGDEFFRSYIRIVLDQFVQGRAQMVNPFSWQTITGNDVSICLVPGNFIGCEVRHGNGPGNIKRIQAIKAQAPQSSRSENISDIHVASQRSEAALTPGS